MEYKKNKKMWLKSGWLLAPLSLGFSSSSTWANADQVTATVGQKVEQAGNQFKKIRPSEGLEALTAAPSAFRAQLGFPRGLFTYSLGNYLNSQALNLFVDGGYAASSTLSQQKAGASEGWGDELKRYLGTRPSTYGLSGHLGFNGRYLLSPNWTFGGGISGKLGYLSRAQKMAGNLQGTGEVRGYGWTFAGSYEGTPFQFDFLGMKERFKDLAQGAHGFDVFLRTPEMFERTLRLEGHFGKTNRFTNWLETTEATSTLEEAYYGEVLLDGVALISSLVSSLFPQSWLLRNHLDLKVGARYLHSSSEGLLSKLGLAMSFNIGDFRHARSAEHNARLAFLNSASFLKHNFMENPFSWKLTDKAPSETPPRLSDAAAGAAETVGEASQRVADRVQSGTEEQQKTPVAATPNEKQSGQQAGGAATSSSAPGVSNPQPQ